MLEQLPQSLPALTALATVIAAGIGAAVALMVALVNAWAARRIAVDTAHREFRSELADRAVLASKKVLAQIHGLDQLRLKGDQEGWRKAVASIQKRGLPLKMDLRTPHDPVFADAVKLFKGRRAQFEMWVLIKYREQIAPFGLTEARAYMMEVAEIVQVSAEAYVFNLRGPRKRAQRLLQSADRVALNRRIEAKLSKYDGLEGEDDSGPPSE
jgi:hypothetical protein